MRELRWNARPGGGLYHLPISNDRIANVFQSETHGDLWLLSCPPWFDRFVLPEQRYGDSIDDTLKHATREIESKISEEHDAVKGLMERERQR